MTHTARSVSACRRCFYYRSEGRRGGQCDLLGASVQGQWSACASAKALFESAIAPGVATKAIDLGEVITTLKVATNSMEPRLLENSDNYETSVSDLKITREGISYLALSGGSR